MAFIKPRKPNEAKSFKKPETKSFKKPNENLSLSLSRFNKNEFALFGLLQLLQDKEILTNEEIEQYTIEGLYKK
jgi:hypothetical protein